MSLLRSKMMSAYNIHVIGYLRIDDLRTAYRLPSPPLNNAYQTGCDSHTKALLQLIFNLNKNSGFLVFTNVRHFQRYIHIFHCWKSQSSGFVKLSLILLMNGMMVRVDLLSSCICTRPFINSTRFLCKDLEPFKLF